MLQRFGGTLKSKNREVTCKTERTDEDDCCTNAVLLKQYRLYRQYRHTEAVHTV